MAAGERSASWKRSISALHFVNYRRYFAGQLLSTLGTWMQITAQIWLVLEISGSERALGLASALQFLPALVLGPWAGVIADRFDNRRLLVLTNTMAGLFALGLGLLSSSGQLTLGWLYAASVAIGLSTVFDRAAGPAFVSALVEPAQLPSAIGLYSVTTSASRMVGIAAAGVFLASSGASVCFYVNAASYVLVIASLLALRRSEITERRSSGEAVRLRDGVTHIWSRPVLRRTLLTTAVIGLLCMNFMILVPAMVKIVFDADATWFGIAEVFSGAGSTAAGFLVGTLQRPRTRTVAIGAASLGAATILTGLAPWLVLFCVLMFVVGITATGFIATSMTVAQANSDLAMRGRVAAFQSLAVQGTTPIGALVMGVVMSELGVRTAMVIAGGSALAAGLILFGMEQRRPSASWMALDEHELRDAVAAPEAQTVQ